MKAKTKVRIRKMASFAGMLVLSACCFFGAYLMRKNAVGKLNETQQYVGVIERKGVITYQTSSAGLFSRTLQNKAFYLKLHGLNQNLGVYNPNEDYAKLDKDLRIGDTVKINYNHSSDTFQLNLELFQIEKNKEIVLAKEAFQNTERKGFYIALIGGIILTLVGFYALRKL